MPCLDVACGTPALPTAAKMQAPGWPFVVKKVDLIVGWCGPWAEAYTRSQKKSDKGCRREGRCPESWGRQAPHFIFLGAADVGPKGPMRFPFWICDRVWAVFEAANAMGWIENREARFSASGERPRTAPKHGERASPGSSHAASKVGRSCVGLAKKDIGPLHRLTRRNRDGDQSNLVTRAHAALANDFQIGLGRGLNNLHRHLIGRQLSQLGAPRGNVSAMPQGSPACPKGRGHY